MRAPHYRAGGISAGKARSFFSDRSRSSTFAASCALVSLGVGIGAAPVSTRAEVAIPFPYTVNFEAVEGYTLGPRATDPVWSFTPGLSVNVTDVAFDGTQSLLFTGDGFLALEPTAQSVAAGYPVTWLDYYLRPVFAAESELPEALDTAASAATGFVKSSATQGEVYAVDGDGQGGGDWFASGHIVGLTADRASAWMRFSYRIDYARKRWDLYLDGEPVLMDLRFADDSVNGFTRFSLRGDSSLGTFFDYFYVGDLNPLFGDANNDGLPDDWLSSRGLSGSLASREADPDFDGIVNFREFLLGLDPADSDTDNDGVHDGRELLRGTNPKVAQSFVLGTLPYQDGFESDVPGAFTNGTRAWTVAVGVGSHANIVSSAAPEGQRALSLSGSDVHLARPFAPATGNPVVWLDFLADLAPREIAPPIVGSDRSAIFYLDQDRRLMAFDGGGGGGIWQAVTTTPSAASPAYRRYTLRLDYAAQSWSLWLDGIRRTQDFGFANAVPYFSGLALDHASGVPAILDRVAATTVEPAELDNDGDGLANADEPAFGTNPEIRDTDGDGLPDGAEVDLATNPLAADALLAHLATDTQGNLVWRAHFSAAEGYSAGPLAGQLGWRADGDAIVTATETARLYSTAEAQPAAFEHLFGNPGISRPWIAFRARLKAGALPAPASITGPVSCLFGFSAESTLSIYNPVTQTWVAHPVTANAADWNHFTLHLDYVAQTWMLRLNGTMVAQGLPFRDPGLTMLARFRMLQAGTNEHSAEAQLDDLVVANVDPLALVSGPGQTDSDGDGLPDLWEVVHGLNPSLPTDAAGNLDGDSLTNLQEYQQGRLPRMTDGGAAFYVNADLGSDTVYNGRSAWPGSPTASHGPKATVSAALLPAIDGDEVILIPGSVPYDESALRPSGRHLILRPVGDVRIR